MEQELETVSGYRLKNRRRLSHWAPLLEEWLLATERYCRIMCGEDAPYFYTERANIGILAGSAWRCGRIALEEFQHEKGLRTQKKSNGRGDLYIAWDDGEEFVEAKLGWLGLHLTDERKIRKIENTLDYAASDARRTIGKTTGTNAIAVAFLPSWQPHKKHDLLSRNIEATVRTIRQSDFGLVAWSFPKLGRVIKSRNQKNVLPGIILVAEDCSHRR